MDQADLACCRGTGAEPAPARRNRTASGSTLTLTDSDCASASGSYTITFSDSCATVSLIKLADSCHDRSLTFDGTTLHR